MRPVLATKTKKARGSNENDDAPVSCPRRVVQRKGVRKSAYIMDSQEVYVASVSEFKCTGYLQIIEELCSLLNEVKVKTKSEALKWVKGEDIS